MTATVNDVWTKRERLLMHSTSIFVHTRVGRAIRFSPYALKLLSVDYRVRQIESRPTGAWIDSMTGTVYAQFGDVVIWFPNSEDYPNGLYLVFPEPAARYLFLDAEFSIIPTPVGIDTGAKREETWQQLTIESSIE